MKKRSAFFLLLTGILLCFIPSTAQTIYYVTQDGSGEGTSWADASNDLQLMINQAAAAEGGGEVWVAAGKYFPIRNAETTETGPLSQDHAFVLQPRVRVYGSFTGSESSPTQRPPRTRDNASVLNGGLTCNHVVISAGDVDGALLDGFDITGGRRTTAGSVDDYITVNGQDIQRTYGGGIVAVSSSPTLRNLLITDNHTYMAGGGIALSYSKSLIENVEITGNSVIGAGGAGILIADHSYPLLTGVLLDGNYFSGSLPPSVSGRFGIAAYVVSFSSAVVTNSIIRNHSSHNGGMAPFFGGSGIPEAPVLLVNVLFANNSGSSTLGAGGIWANGDMELVNVTLCGNSGKISAVANYNGSSEVYLRNCLIYGNTGTRAVGNTNTDVPAFPLNYIANSLIEGSGGSGTGWDPLLGTDEGGNIDQYPLFVSAGTGNYTLSEDSPAVNAGKNDFIPEEIETDLAGNPRIRNGIADIGAYEYYDGSLPVTLTTFRAIREGASVRLSWKTASEQTNKHFEIERSENGAAFRLVGISPANPTRRYAFTDNPPRSGLWYYRLKQVDFDGTFSYSILVSVKTEHNRPGRAIYPNPFLDHITLSLDPHETVRTPEIRVSDFTGRLIRTDRFTGEGPEHTLFLANLPAGLYFIWFDGVSMPVLKR